MNNLRQILFIFLPFIAYVFLAFALQFDGLYGQDSYAYLEYTKAMAKWLNGGGQPGTFHWPIMYPLWCALMDYILPTTSLSLQFVSAISFIGICGLLFHALKPIKKDVRHWFILLSIGSSAYFLRASLLGMSDLFCALWIVISFYSAFRLNVVKSLLLCFFACGMAVSTRYVAIVIVTPLLVFTSVRLLKEKQFYPLIISCILFILPLLPQFLLNTTTALGFNEHQGITMWTPINFFATSFHTNVGLLKHLFPNLLVAFAPFFHPGYLSMGLLILVALILLKLKPTYNSQEKIILLSITCYLLFIAGVPGQNMRFFIPIFPLIIWVTYKPFESLVILLKKSAQRVILLLFALLNLGLFSYSFNKFFVRHRLEKEICNTLSEHSQNQVYCFGFQGAIRTRSPEKLVTSLYYDTIKVFEPNSLIVFNEDAYSKQWEKHVVMYNWNTLKKNNTLHELAQFDNGWKVYLNE